MMFLLSLSRLDRLEIAQVVARFSAQQPLKPLKDEDTRYEYLSAISNSFENGEDSPPRLFA